MGMTDSINITNAPEKFRSAFVCCNGHLLGPRLQTKDFFNYHDVYILTPEGRLIDSGPPRPFRAKELVGDVTVDAGGMCDMCHKNGHRSSAFPDFWLEFRNGILIDVERRRSEP